MEHSPEQTTCWATVTLRKLKSYQASFLTKTPTRKKTVLKKSLNNMLLNNQQITEEIKDELKKKKTKKT